MRYADDVIIVGEMDVPGSVVLYGIEVVSVDDDGGDEPQLLLRPVRETVRA